MADGKATPIEDIKVGDKVVSTDPQTGHTAAQQVVQLHNNIDTDLSDVLVQSGDRLSIIHTTSNHRLWSDDRKIWAFADKLVPGEHLHNPGGQTVTVVSVHRWTQPEEMFDLTIDHVHTFYVMVGGAPVLVHNDPAIPASAQLPDLSNLTQTEADNILGANGFQLTAISGG